MYSGEADSVLIHDSLSHILIASTWCCETPMVESSILGRIALTISQTDELRVTP
ncbi:MAG: hypothetical protein RMY30_038830 [Nostoc sp. CmiSLP01]|nr:hypothetical protein [Nostoc sp. CmiSLP01]